MKLTKILCCTFVLTALLFTACKFEDEAHFTPEIRVISPIVRSHYDTHAHDTLFIYRSEDGLVMDTIFVGDTVFFDVTFNTYANNMQSISIKHDTASVELGYMEREKLDSLFLPESDIDNGEFLLDEGIIVVRLQFYYLALQEDENPKLEFTLTSDSKFSPGMLKFATPIVKPEDLDEGENPAE